MRALLVARVLAGECADQGAVEPVPILAELVAGSVWDGIVPPDITCGEAVPLTAAMLGFSHDELCAADMKFYFGSIDIDAANELGIEVLIR